MDSVHKKIFVIAGEKSGDIHSAKLINQLKSKIPYAEFYGIGGKLMENKGVKIIYDYNKINYIGFSSVIRNIVKLKKILRNTVKNIIEINPDIVILVDSPGFNLKIAEKLKKHKFKVIYYISPQLWAWHKNRLEKLKKYTDKILVIFPFEVDFYKREGIEVYYVGHPLIEKIDKFLSLNSSRNQTETQIVIMPGSRRQEIKKHLPVLSESSLLLKQKLNCKLKILCTDNIDMEYYKKYCDDSNFEFIRDDDNYRHYTEIQNSVLALVKSGTSTLECALIGTPFLVVYKTSLFNYIIGRMIINVKHLSIVNILSGHTVVREFLQKDMKPQKIYQEGLRIINEKKYRQEMVNNFEKIRLYFKEEIEVKNAAEIIYGMLL